MCFPIHVTLGAIVMASNNTQISFLPTTSTWRTYHSQSQPIQSQDLNTPNRANPTCKVNVHPSPNTFRSATYDSIKICSRAFWAALWEAYGWGAVLLAESGSRPTWGFFYKRIAVVILSGSQKKGEWSLDAFTMKSLKIQENLMIMKPLYWYIGLIV